MRRLLLILLRLALVVILAWSALWFGLRVVVERQLDAAEQRIAARGGEIGYERREIGGFPLGYRVTWTRPALRLPQAGGVLNFAGPWLRARVSVLLGRRARLDLPEKLTLELSRTGHADLSLDLASAALRLDARLGLGGVEGVEVTADRLDLRHLAGGPFASLSGEVERPRIAARRIADRPLAVEVSFESGRFSLAAEPSDPGGRLPPFRIAAEKGIMRLAGPVEPAAALSDASVRFEMQALVLDEALWAHIDPDRRLPRDPARLVLAARGPLRWAGDPRRLPGQVDWDALPLLSPGLTVSEFSASAAGLEFTATGRVANLAPGDTPSFPVGEGHVEFTGLDTLTDRLAEIGLLEHRAKVFAAAFTRAYTRALDGEDRRAVDLRLGPEGVFLEERLAFGPFRRPPPSLDAAAPAKAPVPETLEGRVPSAPAD
ncbi:MAG: DUF2125 domain-containing protein [Alphaproteobacteria bacterium]|nr:MAG: DUF2125 domain-containing protein [Alphaproteobacteria bacterium]